MKKYRNDFIKSSKTRFEFEDKIIDFYELPNKSSNRSKAIFLDTEEILMNESYAADSGQIHFLPGILPTLKLLTNFGFKLVIVTNQSGISKGMFSHKIFLEYSVYLEHLFKAYDILMSGFYYCPHFSEAPETSQCLCIKPNPGLLIQAAQELNLDLKQSWIAGDYLDDVEAGKRAGTKTILVNSDSEREWRVDKWRIPDFFTDDFTQIGEIILNHKHEEHVDFSNIFKQ